MEKMEVRVSLKKRVLVTLIPLMCMVGVILDARRVFPFMM